MPSIYDTYEFFLKAADLEGQPRTVQVESAQRREIFDPNAGKNEPAVALRFVGKKKTMVLNKTQAAAMAAATGTDDYSQWPGAHVILTPVVYRKKDTIQVSAVPINVSAPAQPTPKRNPAEIIAELTNGQ